MDRNSPYYKQVQLLVQLLPLVAEENCFALKGGTAINLFVRNLPRLSVDIDLVYLPMQAWDEALDGIKDALSRIGKRIESVFPDAQLGVSFKDKVDALRVVVTRRGVRIKIELSPVLRGTVFPPELMEVHQGVADEFGYAEMAVVALADLYAGKICAALDRQHPRDLYDVMLLLDEEGFTDDIRRALLVYIVSHSRPMAELLAPNRKDIRTIYENEFRQMTEEEVSLEALEETRELLIATITEELRDEDKQFLLSFKKRAPDWSLLGLEGVEQLPAVRWKLRNLARMDDGKHQKAYVKLLDVLGVEEAT